MRQIERLQSVIPSQAESERARKGLARIDTSQMQHVVRQIHDAANEMLISLETSASPRHVRQGDTPLDGRLIDLGARKARGASASFKKPTTSTARRRTHQAARDK